MLTRRIIGKILLNGELAIQSKGFQQFLPLGKPEIIAQSLDEWGVDEIVIFDRLASKHGKCINIGIIEKIVSCCRVLTVFRVLEA